MKNYSVLKHSLRTGSLSILECFNTRIELAGTEMSQTVRLICLSDVMAACRSPKPFVGVRVPRGMPSLDGSLAERTDPLLKA